MKIKLTKDEHKALHKDIQSEYEQDGDDFILKLEDGDGEDLGALRNARDHEKKKRQAAEKKTKELTTRNKELEEEKEELEKAQGEDGKVDVKAIEQRLEKKYSTKADKAKTDLEAQITKRDEKIKILLVDNVAKTLAAEISTTPKAMERIIKDRLRVEWDGDEPKTVVLDEDGEPSGLSVAELKKEIMSDKSLSGLIKGSQASGGGADGGKGEQQGGAFKFSDYQNADKTVNWSKVSEASKADPTILEKVKTARQDPANQPTNQPGAAQA